MWSIARIKGATKRFFQRRFRGWDDSETWSMDYTFVEWIIPRLKRFKQLENGHPSDLSWETWQRILDDMIEGFEFYLKEDELTNYEKREDGKFKKAMFLFYTYLENLWW